MHANQIDRRKALTLVAAAPVAAAVPALAAFPAQAKDGYTPFAYPEYARGTLGELYRSHEGLG